MDGGGTAAVPSHAGTNSSPTRFQHGGNIKRAPGASGQDRFADWIDSVTQLHQDVRAVLRSSCDTQPCSDAAAWEGLCERMRRTAEDAANSAGICANSERLAALQQLASALMQLAGAVFCDRDVAAQMLAVGSYTRSSEALRSAVKAFAGLLVAQLEAVAAAAAAATAASTGAGAATAAAAAAVVGVPPAATAPADAATAAVEAGDPLLLQAASTTALGLLHVGLGAAALVAGAVRGASQGHDCAVGSSMPAAAAAAAAAAATAPREMRSMAVLSLAWTNLTRLLLAPPPGARGVLLPQDKLLLALRTALYELRRAVRELPAAPPERRETVTRFWLQSASRLTSVVSGDCAAAEALAELQEATSDIYCFACFPGPSHAAVAPFLQTVLQPRLAACLTALVGCQPAEPDAVSARTQQLMATAGRAAAGSQTQCGPPSCCVTQQEAAAARLLVVFDTMQQLPAQCAAAAIGPLLSWAPLALGAGDCCAFVLTHDSGGALLQHALQACLACWTTAAYGQPPPMHTQLLMTVTGMALHEHPLVAFAAQQLLADALACSSRSVQLVHLADLAQLLSAASAAGATPGCGRAAAALPLAVVDALAAALQACDAGVAASWTQQHASLQQLQCGSDGWPDAADCALVVCRCQLLARLPTSLWPSCVTECTRAEAPLTQLWLAARQLWELTGGLLDDPPSPAMLLALHQMTWILEAQRAVLTTLGSVQQQPTAADAAAAAASPAAAGGPGSSIAQACAALAADVLCTLCSRGGSNGSSSSSSSGQSGGDQAPTTSVRAACFSAALGVLAAAGLAPPEDGARELLSVLHSLLDRGPLQQLLAAAAGSLRLPPGNTTHEELFHSLLCSQRWPVRHAALDALLCRLRHANYSGSGILRLLPRSLRVGEAEAAPAILEAIKAHLNRRPDSQALQAHAEQYNTLAEQHASVLADAMNNASLRGAGSVTATVAEGLSWLAAAVAAAAAGSNNVQHAIMPSPGRVITAAAGGGTPPSALQSLLELSAGASSSLQALEEALGRSEAQVSTLLAAAHAAATSRSLGSEHIAVLARQGTNLAGSCASMCSRLRCLQDALSRLKG